MPSSGRRGPVARLVLAASAVGLFVMGYYWGNQYKYGRGPPAIQGVLISPAMPLPGFRLEDTLGRPFGDDDLTGVWTLFAFGEVSGARGQLAVTRMIQVHNRLADRPELRDRLRLALAATRQSPNLARDFAQLSPALRVLSGEDAELGRIAAVLGAPADGRGGEPAALYLIAPDGSLLALFPAGQAAESIADDLITVSRWPLEALTAPAND